MTKNLISVKLDIKFIVWKIVLIADKCKRRINLYFTFGLPALLSLLLTSSCTNKIIEKYRNKELSLEIRVNDLIGRMTLAEKVAQLQGIRPTDLTKDGKLSLTLCREKIPNGISHLCQYSSTLGLKPEQLAEFVTQLQCYILTETRLGIPVICHEEAITGMAAYGATTFPQQLGMSCTWDEDLIRGNCAAIARTMRLAGATEALSPMIDIADDARWGRIEEGFGEDPYLVSLMGLAFVQGIQGEDLSKGVAATVKHFAGSRIKTETPTEFYDDVLMPFDVAIRKGKAASVMMRYGTFNEIPSVASPFLIDKILRNRMGFDGQIVSDYGAMTESYSDIGPGSAVGVGVKQKNAYFKSATEAAVGSLNAGLDVELMDGRTFKEIPKAFEQGAISIETINKAVRRVLTLKIRLGLLDADAVFAGKGELDFNPPENQQRALQSARKSLVLLKNDNILPLKEDVKSIAVVGPNADSYYALLGDYTYQMLAEYFHRRPVDPTLPKLITLLSGLRNNFDSKVKIEYERGCDWVGSLDGIINDKSGDSRLITKKKRYPLESVGTTDPQRAIKIAAESDLIIAAMGETRYLSGENNNRDDIRLPGDQEEFVKHLIATGKPVILVVFGGRPMILTDIAVGCRAIIYAWYPGQAGGQAVADLLLGKFNPSGKLTTTMPRNKAQVPTSYRQGYNKNDPPLFPFGHGLSYTTYGYSNLDLPTSVKTNDNKIPIRFKLTNNGKREGNEIAQLYFVSREGLPSRLAMMLKGFARVALQPGETKIITIEVSPQQFASHDKEGNLRIQPGNYDVLVGASSTDIRLRTTINITGDQIILKSRNEFFSKTTIDEL